MEKEKILSKIKNAKSKSLAVISKDEVDFVEILKSDFKTICLFQDSKAFQLLKEDNLEIKKLELSTIVEDLKTYDAILFAHEFHHLSDLEQIAILSSLKPNQDLFLVEYDSLGNQDYLYSCFKNCRPLCSITKEILNKFFLAQKIMIKTDKVSESFIFQDLDFARDYYKSTLPEYYAYGEKEFEVKLSSMTFPYEVWESYDVLHIKKA
jgi:hypothetical protein